MGKIERIEVPPEDRERLVKLVRDRNTPQKIVWRSQIVLLAGEGIGAVEVARRVGKSVLTVRRWRRRYAAKGVEGLLKDATRPGGRKPLTARKSKQGVDLTLNEKPSDATHWSERMMAARAGIAPSSVHKIWVAHGLKPHLTKTVKLSPDPNYVAKVEWQSACTFEPHSSARRLLRYQLPPSRAQPAKAASKSPQSGQ